MLRDAMRAFCRVVMLPVMVLVTATTASGETLTIGSKRFTESYILGEILAQKARAAGEASVVHQQGLGNTAIVVSALTSRNIDLYPEYTGTIAKEILHLDK